MSNIKFKIPEGFTPWHFTDRSGPAGTTPDTEVEVVLRDGRRERGLVADFDWDDDSNSHDIIGWRVVDKVVVPAEDAHPHAHLMLEYAKDAMTRPDPWLLWESRAKVSDYWQALDDHPRWVRSREYRRKPIRIPTRVINGFEVPAPVTARTSVGDDDYFAPDPASDTWYHEYSWNDDHVDERLLDRGMVFLHKDHAIANAKAMCGVDPKWSQE